VEAARRKLACGKARTKSEESYLQQYRIAGLLLRPEQYADVIRVLLRNQNVLKASDEV
jgi:hypothetical protein